jgi:hypothetical protein
MKALLFSALLFSSIFTNGQSFSGRWKGTITRDYGNETVTDSLLLELKQEGDKVTGYSVLYVKPHEYIRSVVEGAYQQNNKTLRLTETSIEFTNIPDRGESFFLDLYLLTYDENNKEILTGKSVPCDKKAIYTRSKMVLRKAVADGHISGAVSDK